MRLVLTLLVCLPGIAAAAAIPDARTVYLLPMASGFDQYLANHLTNNQILQVVTDPKAADLIFTDRLGTALEHRLDELVAEPKPAAKEESKAEGEQSEQAAPANMVVGEVPRAASFGRGKGNVFLVDVKSRQLVWSTYEPPKDFTPKQLDRSAGRVVSRLKKTLAGK